MSARQSLSSHFYGLAWWNSELVAEAVGNELSTVALWAVRVWRFRSVVNSSVDQLDFHSTTCGVRQKKKLYISWPTRKRKRLMREKAGLTSFYVLGRTVSCVIFCSACLENGSIYGHPWSWKKFQIWYCLVDFFTLAFVEFIFSCGNDKRLKYWVLSIRDYLRLFPDI